MLRRVIVGTLMEPITAKLRPEEKQTFIQMTESLGTTPSNAIRMFVTAFNKHGGFPFDTSNPCGFNRVTMKAMEDAAFGRDLSGPFLSTDELFTYIFAEGEDA